MHPLRVRKRYIAIKILSEKQQTKQETLKSIRTTTATLYGEQIISQADLRILEYDQRNRQAILRCTNSALYPLRESIQKVTEIAGTPTTMRIIGVSGTIKRLRQKFLK